MKGKTGAVLAVILVVVISLAVLLLKPDTANVPTPGAQSGGHAAHSGQVTSVSVEVEGMSFTPNTIEVPVGNELEVTFTNTGDQRHDLVFANGVGTEPLAPGESATINVGVIDSDLLGWCSLPGHRQMGMELTVVAGDAAAAEEIPAQNPHPAELGALDNQTVREYTFTVTEGEGLTPWTFNGTAPGPTLHGRVGDEFVITLVNDGTMGHSIDFHAGEVAPDAPMRTIEPGESLEYRFTANRAGIWMYHCSTMPMSLHIANGMFGAVIIEPEGLPAADRNYVLIQSGIYLDNEVTMTPDLMAFNGQPFQYDEHPLQARVGETVRFWLLNVGPNEDLSFHVVGGQFNTVWKEGAYLLDDAVTTGSQAVDLAPAQGGFVEMIPLEAGTYTFVNHIMSLAEMGAHGKLVVTD